MHGTTLPRSSVVVAWQYLRQQPGLLVTIAYVLASFVGVWCSYWFYDAFNIPVLQFLQPSDFLVAAFRDPAYVTWLLSVVAVVCLASLPTFYWRRHPKRVVAHRRTWWGRWVLFPDYVDPSRPIPYLGWTQETALALMVAWLAVWVLQVHVRNRAHDILAGGGDRIAITLAGDALPLQGQARLLGTSSGHVFVYWPTSGRAEAIANEAIGRIEALPRRAPAVQR